MLDRAITVNTTDKFRNQYVEATIAVPEGHYIKIDKNFGYGNRVRYRIFTQDPDWYYYNNDNSNDYDYSYDVKYIMKQDGLYTLDGKRSDGRDDDWNGSSDNNNESTPPANDQSGTYRYDNNPKLDSLKNAQEKQIQKMQAAVDSMKQAREKEVNHLRDSLNKAKEEIDKKIENLNRRTALIPNCGQKTTDNYTFIMYI
jgi:hypothetical protein